MKTEKLIIVILLGAVLSVIAMVWAHNYEEQKRLQELTQRQEQWRRDSTEHARYIDSTERAAKHHMDSLWNELIKTVKQKAK